MPLIRKAPGTAASETVSPSPSLAGLNSGSSDERWAAARTCDPSAESVAALSQALAKEDDQRVREAIFTKLVLAATPESVAAILSCLRADDANIRTGALDALRAMPQVAEPYLESLLADPDPDVRLLACEIARQISGTKATGILCTLLDREVHKNVCAAAVDVLAEIGNVQALPVLARLGERFPQEPFLLFAIKIASERIGHQAASHK
jgi:HEAT repeat protein